MIKIQILPDKSDVYVSHADWSNYRTMLKVLKRYTMPLKRSPVDDTLINAVDTVFSSYPGTLHSIGKKKTKILFLLLKILFVFLK